MTETTSEIEQLQAERDDMAQAAAMLVKLARNRADQFEAAIERVRALHKRFREDIAVCDYCDEDFPCMTIRVLDSPVI